MWGTHIEQERKKGRDTQLISIHWFNSQMHAQKKPAGQDSDSPWVWQEPNYVT